jgi:hypothetical protein
MVLPNMAKCFLVESRLDKEEQNPLLSDKMNIPPTGEKKKKKNLKWKRTPLPYSYLRIYRNKEGSTCLLSIIYFGNPHRNGHYIVKMVVAFQF